MDLVNPLSEALEMALTTAENPEGFEEAKVVARSVIDCLIGAYVGERVGVVLLGLVITMAAITDAKSIGRARIH